MDFKITMACIYHLSRANQKRSNYGLHWKKWGWTKDLYNKIKSPCYRSIFVLGPFASEFSDKAVNTVNAIAIASGIGITPVLSLMLSYVGKKKINLIWMCRDSGLIEYILHMVDLHALTKKSYALIYYTGKRELYQLIFRLTYSSFDLDQISKRQYLGL